MAIIFTVFLEVNFCKINTINTLQMENTKKGRKIPGIEHRGIRGFENGNGRLGQELPLISSRS